MPLSHDNRKALKLLCFHGACFACLALAIHSTPKFRMVYEGMNIEPHWIVKLVPSYVLFSLDGTLLFFSCVIFVWAYCTRRMACKLLAVSVTSSAIMTAILVVWFLRMIIAPGW